MTHMPHLEGIMADDRGYTPPEHSTGDTAHSVAKAALSFIPGATDLFEFFVLPPLEKRRQKWMEEVAQGLRELERKGLLNLEELENNEAFITILVQTSQAAIRNHQAHKLMAFRGVVLNAAINIDIAEDLQLRFVSFVDELTPSHIALLQFLAHYEDQLAKVASYDTLFQRFLAEGKCKLGQDEFLLLCADLTGRALVQISPDMKAFPGVYESDKIITDRLRERGPMLRVTDIGHSFLRFITQPA